MATEDELRGKAYTAYRDDPAHRRPSILDFYAGWNALAELLGRVHYVTYTEDGWTTEHSLECRLAGNMVNCAHARAAGAAADPGVLLGRYRIAGIAENGHAMLERADA